jgi:hypothetical protein
MAMKVELGRSEAEVFDQLARLASLRRQSNLAGGAWPVGAYVAAAMTLILTARTVIGDCRDGEQMIRGRDGRWYVRYGSYCALCLAGPVEARRPITRRRSLLVSMMRRLFR